MNGRRPLLHSVECSRLSSKKTLPKHSSLTWSVSVEKPVLLSEATWLSTAPRTFRIRFRNTSGCADSANNKFVACKSRSFSSSLSPGQTTFQIHWVRSSSNPVPLHTLSIVHERIDIRQIAVVKVLHVKRKRIPCAIPIQTAVYRQSGVTDVLDERVGEHVLSPVAKLPVPCEPVPAVTNVLVDMVKAPPL